MSERKDNNQKYHEYDYRLVEDKSSSAPKKSCWKTVLIVSIAVVAVAAIAIAGVVLYFKVFKGNQNSVDSHTQTEFPESSDRFEISQSTTIGFVTREPPVQRLKGHTDGVVSLAALHNRLLASGSYDRSVRIWNPMTGECIKVLENLDPEAVWRLAVLANGNLVTSGDQIRIWDHKNNFTLIRSFGNDSFIRFAVLPNDRLVSLTSPTKLGNKLQLWDTKNGTLLITTEKNSFVDVFYLSGGNILCSTGRGVIYSFDSKTLKQKPEKREMDKENNYVFSMVSLKNDRFACGSRNAVYIWSNSCDPQTMLCSEISRLSIEFNHANSLAVLSSGYLAVGSYYDNGKVQIWDPETNVKIATIESKFNFSNSCLVVLPETGYLASGYSSRGNSDNSIKIIYTGY